MDGVLYSFLFFSAIPEKCLLGRGKQTHAHRMTGIRRDSLTTYPLIWHTHADRYNATKIITNSLLERSRGRDGVRDLWVDMVAYSGGGGNSGGAGSTEFTGVLDKCFGFFFFYR